MTDLTVLQKIIVWALPLIFAITLHEVAHGFVAYLLGDNTARFSGRLTMNPIKHIDWIGTVLVPLLMMMAGGIIFGWAKPVPIDPRNFNHPRRDMALTALAGPLSNLIMAFFWGGVAKIGLIAHMSGNDWLGKPLVYMGAAGIMLNIMLGVLNLIPLPPLDGGKVLEAVLPRRAAYQLSLLEPYGFIILILLMLTGVLWLLMWPFMNWIGMVINSIYGLG